MIHPSTTVHVLDLRTGEPLHLSVEALFQMYADRATYHPSGIGDIHFNPAADRVKIQEWTGWTELLKIEKSPPDPLISWYEVQIDDKRKVIVSDDEVIPIYDKEETKQGFHGEVKFAYSLWSVPKMHGGEIVRHRRLDGDDINPIQFAPVTVTPYKNLSAGYNIVTKSQFYNGNDFHLWGLDAVPLSEIEKWYK